MITYIVPALTVPSGLISRYSDESVAVKNFVAIPKIAVTHIQNTAPGPPKYIAAATPAILPNPIVPESVAVRALK